MPKENKYRLKIILTKHTAEEPLEDTDIIKFEEEELDENVDVMKLSVDNTITLFYRQQGGFSPKWYKDYLLEKDKKLKNSYSQGIFFKKIEYEGKEYKFAISFGGAETLLNPEHVEPRFGLIVALNLAESIYSLKKNTISDTMSKVREDALKGQEIQSFSYDFDKDLLKGVIVTPKNNSIALGNIIGKDYLSFTTSHGLEQIEFLLKECIIYYLKDDYKKDYGFVDNIKEIPKHNPITMDIHDSILLALKNKEIDKVWFAPPELIDWDKKLYFGLYKNRKVKNILSQVKKIDEIDLDNLHEYLIENGFNFSSIDDLKKFKVINILDDETEGESWNFYQCLYSSIKLENNKQYILNESNIYEVDNDFYNDYENKYLKLKLYASNLKYEGNMTETEFNSKVARENPTYTLLDKKLVSKNKRSFEICDLFDNLNNLFIHVKKYGQSAVLSHLFSQAKVAADLFKDQSFRAEIINKMKEVNPSGKYDKLTYRDVEIVMAIITNKQIPSNGFVQIPFFSKVNVITTIDYIKNKYNYKNAGLMFIDLKELENENEINRDKN